jgi:hypothetical protein
MAIGNYSLEGKALRGKYCYIPDSSRTPLGPRLLPEHIRTSKCLVFHSSSDTSRTPYCSMHIRTHLGLRAVPCTSRHPSDSVLLPDNSSQMHLLSLPSSYSLYDTHSFTYYSIILKSLIIYLTLCPYHMIHVATYISLHGIYLI